MHFFGDCGIIIVLIGVRICGCVLERVEETRLSFIFCYLRQQSRINIIHKRRQEINFLCLLLTKFDKLQYPAAHLCKKQINFHTLETAFRELKYTMGLTHLHARREDFVKQEIFARIIMCNFGERIHSAIRVQQNKDNKYEDQINFKMGMRICVDYYRGTVRSRDFYDLIENHLIPIRPGRSGKRKIRPKSFISFTYRVA